MISEAKKTFGKILSRPRLSSLTVLLVLALAATFSVALVIRAMPARYGFYLNEFDPYFDYYATDYIVKNVDQSGLSGAMNYFSWRDTRTWYPEGRPVASSSQVGLHFAAAFLYLTIHNLLGANLQLYDFLVLFPVFFGALTTLAVFLLVRRLVGTTAGVFASLMVAVSPPILSRGSLGWFKSEPLALFLAVLASYLFISIYEHKVSPKGVILRSVGGGLLLGYATTSWGGTQYFSLVFGLLFLAAPFLRVDLERTVTGGVLFVASTLLVAASLPRPGPSIILGTAGLPLLVSLAFALLALTLKRFVEPRSYVRVVAKMLFAVALLAGVALGSGAISGLSGRYATVIYPFYRSDNPLIESVAEHFIPTGADYFASTFVIIFLSGLGAVLLIKKRDIHSSFLLIFAATAIYIASSFSRLMVYSALAFAFLGAVGLSELLKAVFKPRGGAQARRRGGLGEGRPEAKVFFSAAMIVLLVFPAVYPPQSNWIGASDIPVSIAGAGLGIRGTYPDWLEALEWIRENTPRDAVLASWWDYGYWITVMGNRTTLADNATINQTRIAQLGRMFMSDEKEAKSILNSLGAKYIVTFMAGVRIKDPNTARVYHFMVNPSSGQAIGGDEAKKQWFIRIGGLNITQYVYSDGITPTPYFWDKTLLGRMFPLQLLGYLGSDQRLRNEYEENTVATFNCVVKYPTSLDLGADCSVRPESGFLKLVYASSSMSDSDKQLVAAVLIYQIVGEPFSAPPAS